MDLLKPAEASAAPSLRERDQIADRFKWDLTKIYSDWNAWHAAYVELDRKIDEFATLRGSLARGGRFSAAPDEACAALSSADVKRPTVVLPSGVESTLTYGQYRAVLATNPNQADRAAAFHEFHKVYETTVNAYAALYNGVL